MGCWCARTGQNRATLFSLEQRDRGTGKHARWQGITRQKGCPKSKSKEVCVLSPTHALGAGRHLEVLKIKGFRREGWRPAAGRCRTRGLPRAAPRHASRARARWAAGSALQRGGGKGRRGEWQLCFATAGSVGYGRQVKPLHQALKLALMALLHHQRSSSDARVWQPCLPLTAVAKSKLSGDSHAAAPTCMAGTARVSARMKRRDLHACTQACTEGRVLKAARD